MQLIKYMDQQSSNYTYFWTYKFSEVEKVVSPVFYTEDEALLWAIKLKEKVNESTKQD
jgi:hypothetical protein